MAPIVAREAAEHDVPIIEVDIETESDEVDRLGVRGIPTLIAFRDGGEVGRLVGVQQRVAVAGLFGAARGDADVVRARAPWALVGPRAGAGAVVVAAGVAFASLPLIVVGVALLLWALTSVVRH